MAVIFSTRRGILPATLSKSRLDFASALALAAGLSMSLRQRCSWSPRPDDSGAHGLARRISHLWPERLCDREGLQPVAVQDHRGGDLQRTRPYHYSSSG